MGKIRKFKLPRQITDNSEMIDLESILIQLSIFYTLATEQDDQNSQLADCATILEKEIGMAMNESTLFYFEGIEHIVNKLSGYFTGMDKDEYIEIVKNVIAKINYYDELVNEQHLMNLGSEKDVEQLADEIICFNMGFNELKDEAISNVSAMYELGNRFYYAKMYDEAYKYYQNADQKGYKKATFMRVLCMYNGEGTLKDEAQAFKDAKELIENEVHTGAMELLGEMYYYGNGTKQNYNKAIECFESVEDEERKAQYYLGIMYLEGKGIQKDEKAGIEYIIKSARKQCPEAINYIIKLINHSEK